MSVGIGGWMAMSEAERDANLATLRAETEAAWKRARSRGDEQPYWSDYCAMMHEVQTLRTAHNSERTARQRAEARHIRAASIASDLETHLAEMLAGGADAIEGDPVIPNKIHEEAAQVASERECVERERVAFMRGYSYAMRGHADKGSVRDRCHIVYPLPPTTRHRVVRDVTDVGFTPRKLWWTVHNGRIALCDEDGSNPEYPVGLTPKRVRLWYDLLEYQAEADAP